MKYKFGLTTFLESGINKESGMTTHGVRIRNSLEEIVLADKLGLDFYGIGEHHRYDYASSIPEVILAAAAPLTKNIILGSAVTVLSSSDPVRIYQGFSTLDLISEGRAEIMAGRGSFTESFPLFGYDMKYYNEIFEEKLDLLININEHEYVSHDGKFRPSINNLPIYPRAHHDKLKISIAVGGTTSSVVRAARLGLPVVFAIIGGDPLRFRPLINMYKVLYERHGHNPEKMEISIHSHGFISRDKNIFDKYFPSHHAQLSKIGKERGWSGYSKEQYLSEIEHGSLYVGTPEKIANKIYHVIKGLGINRFLLHHPGSYMPHEDVMESLRLYGEEVVFDVKKRLKE